MTTNKPQATNREYPCKPCSQRTCYGHAGSLACSCKCHEPPATPEELSDQQIIEPIAKLMGWRVQKEEGYETVAFTQNSMCITAKQLQEDWTLWRRVEEKVMEDAKLWSAWIVALADEYGCSMTHGEQVMKADLPTRCKALIAALDSL